LFLVQENPFQRAARQQQRFGSSSSSTAGGSSDVGSISSTSSTTSPSASREHVAVAVGGIDCCFHSHNILISSPLYVTLKQLVREVCRHFFLHVPFAV
jgi:hypothetical protein